MDNKKQPLHLVFTIDKSFIRHFSVALVSLLENNKHIDLNIYIIHDMDNLDELNSVIKFFKRTYNFNAQILSLDNSVLDNYKVSMHLSKAVYFRLFLSEILSDTLDKILFLDADLVVTGSLSELAAYQFEENVALLAQTDLESDINAERLTSMGFPAKKYFNAGVLLINLKYWRENNLSKTFVDIAQKFMDQLLWWDQDILNMALHDKWDLFDRKFNTLPARKKADVTPTIIHYAGPSKPWHYMNRNPYKSIYWKYNRLTPYKSVKLEGRTLRNIWFKHYIFYKVWLINTFTDKNY